MTYSAMTGQLEGNLGKGEERETYAQITRLCSDVQLEA